MGLIYVPIVLIVLFILTVIGAAFSSLPAHWAACLAKAEYPDLRNTFIILLKGNLFVVLAGVLGGIFGIDNPLIAILVTVGAMIWIIYSLITTLGIVGTVNIIIFLIMLIILEIIMSFVFGMIMSGFFHG